MADEVAPHVTISIRRGSHTIIEGINHVSFVDTKAGTTVSTVAHQDSGNTYSADGAFLSRATFHIVERLGKRPLSNWAATAWSG